MLMFRTAEAFWHRFDNLLWRSVSCAIVAVCAANCGKPADCEARDLLAQAQSPDSRWTAALYSNVCAAGTVTSASVTAEIRPAGSTALGYPDNGVIFGMEDFGAASRQPLKIEWVDPSTVRITLPNEALIGRQLSNFDGITISYAYEPDDLAVRKCLNEWLHDPSASKPLRWPDAKAKCK
jgi:hypothetical protein